MMHETSLSCQNAKGVCFSCSLSYVSFGAAATFNGNPKWRPGFITIQRHALKVLELQISPNKLQIRLKILELRALFKQQAAGVWRPAGDPGNVQIGACSRLLATIHMFPKLLRIAGMSSDRSVFGILLGLIQLVDKAGSQMHGARINVLLPEFSNCCKMSHHAGEVSRPTREIPTTHWTKVLVCSICTTSVQSLDMFLHSRG